MRIPARQAEEGNYRRARAHFGVADRTMTNAVAIRLTRDIVHELGLTPPRGSGNNLPENRSLSYGLNSLQNYSWSQWEGVLPKEFVGKSHPGYRMALVRVGNLFFIDAAHYDRLGQTPEGQALQQRMGPNAILIENLFGAYLGNSHLLSYAMTSIVLLMNTRLEGRHFLDASAGDGATALAAYKLGVQEGTLIEIRQNNVDRLNHNLKINGIGRHFQVIAEDWRNVRALVPKLKPSRLPIVLSAGFGSKKSKMVGNVDSMYYIAHFSQISDVLFAGYTLGAKDQESTAALAKELAEDREIISALGFHVDPEDWAVFAWAFPYTDGITVGWKARREVPPGSLRELEQKPSPRAISTSA